MGTDTALDEVVYGDSCVCHERPVIGGGLAAHSGHRRGTLTGDA